jgi:hypothetical protein
MWLVVAEEKMRGWVGLALVALVGLTAAGPTPPLISARLSAAPSSYSGACPTKIAFAGTITAPHPGKVTYRFVRSDGGAENPETLDFVKPGMTLPVGMVWELGGPSFSDYRGWLMIEILEPIHLQATPATFRLRCAAKGARTP